MACPHQRSSLGSGEILDIEDLGRESDHSDSHPSQPNGSWEEGVDGKVGEEVCQDESQQITQHHGWKIHQSTIVPGAKLAARDASAIGPLLACPSHAYIFHLPSGMSRQIAFLLFCTNHALIDAVCACLQEHFPPMSKLFSRAEASAALAHFQPAVL